MPFARLQLGRHLFNLEMADDPASRMQGLMHRERIAPDGGMLFRFESPQETRFWMKNTRMPLDMIFAKDNRIRHIVYSAPPCKHDPCPTYASRQAVDMVIELPGGTAKRLGLRAGNILRWPEGIPDAPVPPVLGEQ